MELELISSNRCPFVMRSIVAMEQKQVPYKITFVDPYDPPEWFSEISPLGKVPVLRIDTDTILFESAVINEYLDEVTPGQLHPQDPLQKAINRSWIEFGGTCLSDSFRLMAVTTESDFADVKASLRSSLERIETVLDEQGPYFNGADFSLADAAYAPLFIRMEILEDLIGFTITDGLPKVERWKTQMLTLDSVDKARFNGLPDRFRELMQEKGAYAESLLKSAA